MKPIPTPTGKLNAAKNIPLGMALAASMAISHQGATAAVLAVNLGTSSSFAVLAGAGITVAGPVNSTVIHGDIGSFPTISITGLENVILDGVNHAGDSTTQAAKIDLDLAYTDAAGRSATVVFPPIQDLGGLTLASGVYNNPTSFFITGTLTLDAGGDVNSIWIFQTGSTLITGSGSMVNLTNGAQAGNVYWQVGSSATLGVASQFEGTIMAQESITMTTDSTMNGRALALVGAVTLDNNTIAIPEVGSAFFLSAGMILIPLLRRGKHESPSLQKPAKC